MGQLQGFDILKSCYQCGKCTGFCPLSMFGNFSPRIIARDFLIDSKPSQKIWKCLTCDLCSTNCPMDIKFSEFILSCRLHSNELGLEKPEEAHSCYFSSISKFMSHEVLQPKRHVDISSDIKHVKTGDILFFRGCVPFFNLESHVSGLEKDYTIFSRSVVRLLNYLDIKPILLENERCCGHDALWQGDFTTFERLARLNIDSIEKTGAKLVIFNCAEGYRTFKIDYPNYFGKLNFQVISFPEFLDRTLKESGKVLRSFRDISVTYHDPCRLGRQLKVFDAPRDVLKNIDGVKLLEMENNREQASCCGVNSWLNCNQESKALRKMRLQEAEDTGSDYLITTCPKCQVHFNCLKKELVKENKQEFKIEIKDFAVFIAEALNLI
ncbi:MAG: (Fe-S)-binding protein [Candidatus Helarchaeota archaeon]